MIAFERGRWRSTLTSTEQRIAASSAVDQLTQKERAGLDLILAEYETEGASTTANEVVEFEWEEVPLPIDEWLQSDYHVGETGKDLYPVLRADMRELFHAGALHKSGYAEAVFTGAIGWGKGYLASFAVMRVIYELLCLKNPQHTLGMGAGEPIHIVPISRTVAQAKRVVFGAVCKKLNLASWFRGKYIETMEEVRFKKKGVYIVGGASQDASALGLNVICLVGDTLVKTPDGDVRIDALTDGVRVLAFDRQLGCRVWGSAASPRLTKRDAPIVRVTLSNGQHVRCTDDHKFLRTSGQFAPAGDLRPGDALMGLDDDPVRVQLVMPDGTCDVYDLTVPGYENFALAAGVFAHNCALVDESNFMGEGKVTTGSSSSESYDKATMIYNALARRVKSRFQRHGVSGLVFLISSKRSTNDFTERHLRKAMKNDDSTVFVRDYPVWEVNPEPFIGQRWHRVMVSPKTGRSRVLGEGEEVEEDDETLVLDYPHDYHQEFVNDTDGSVRDFGGIATDFAGRLFIGRRIAIDAMIDGTRPRWFKTQEWRTDRLLRIDWTAFLDRDARDDPICICCPKAIRHVHIDLSENHCATGFCMGHVCGAIEVQRRDPDTGEEHRENAPMIHIDCVLRIVASDGGDVDHSEVRGLVYRLMAKGVPIRSVSMDQYMAPSNLQIFKKRGLKVQEIGERRFKMKPYIATRQAIYEERMVCPPADDLVAELKALEMTDDGRKVKKPPRGTKDLADSLAGVVYYITENMRVGTVLAPSLGTSLTPTGGGAQWTADGDVIWGDEAPTPSSLQQQQGDEEGFSLCIISG